MAITETEIEYLSLEGGGAKGTGYLGALVALEELSVLPCTPGGQIKGISGSSIGAIVGMCVGMGYSASEINARLIRDRPFSVLHAEPYRAGMTRSFKYFTKAGGPVKVKTSAVTENTPGKDLEDIGASALKQLSSLAALDIKKFLKTQGPALQDFLTDWVVATLGAALSDEKMLTQFIYDGALKSMKKNKAFIAKYAIVADILQWVFLEGGENILGVGEGMENSQSVTAQFLTWLNSEPFESGFFEQEDDRKQTLYWSLAIAIIVSILVVLLPLAFAPNQFESRRNKLLLLKIFIHNYLYNYTHPQAYNGVFSLYEKLKSIGVKVAGSADSTNNLDFTGTMDEAFEEILAAVVDLAKGAPAQAMLDAVVKDGGLFTGSAVRVILAEMIYARVDVKGDSKAPVFSLREHPVKWDDAKDRDTNPALNTVREGELKSRLDDYETVINAALIEGRKPAREWLKARESLLETVSEITDLEKKRRDDVVAIIKHFDFKNYFNLFGVDLCVTGTNITTSRTVFFNQYLTPEMPVVDAVGISSSFPFLFKPVRLEYIEQTPVDKANFRMNIGQDGAAIYPPATIEDWYKENYCGWFIDGGLLTNLPIHAFNGHAGLTQEHRYRTPVNMMQLPLNPKVLGLVLDSFEEEEDEENSGKSSTKGDKKMRHSWVKQSNDFREKQSVPQGLLSILGAVATGAAMTHSTMHALPTDAFNNGQVVLLDSSDISLFDLTPSETSLLRTDYESYMSMMKHFRCDGFERKSAEDLWTGFGRDRKKSRQWRRSRSSRQLRQQSRETMLAAIRI